MPEIMGLDIGTKRVGVAISDRSTLLATPFQTFRRAGHRAEGEILKLIATHGIQTIAVGLPLNEDGSLNEQSLNVQIFCRRLERRSSAKIIFVDEYLSSFEARRVIYSSARAERRGRKRGDTDATAAAIILRRYLESQEENKVLDGEDIK